MDCESDFCFVFFVHLRTFFLAELCDIFALILLKSLIILTCKNVHLKQRESRKTKSMGCITGRCLGSDDTGYPGAGTTQSISVKASLLIGKKKNKKKISIKNEKYFIIL